MTSLLSLVVVFILFLETSSGSLQLNSKDKTEIQERFSTQLKHELATLCPACEYACRILQLWKNKTHSNVGPLLFPDGWHNSQQTPRETSTFLLIGTQKGGTSDLYTRLLGITDRFALRGVRVCRKGGKDCSQHEKELHFLDWACLMRENNIQRSFRWKHGWCNMSAYRHYFDSVAASMENNGSKHQLFTGDATSNYLFHPGSSTLAKIALPKAKVVALLRNPVSRAYSGYFQHQLKQGHDSFETSISFDLSVVRQCEEIFDREIDEYKDTDIFKDCIYPLLAVRTLNATLNNGGPWEQRSQFKSHPRQCSPPFVHWFSHISRGLYYYQIRSWLREFPKDQIMFIKSEDYFMQPEEHVKAIVDFLYGMDPTKALQSVPKHVDVEGELKGQNSKSQGEMELRTKSQLAKLYEPYNKLLYRELARLGYNFNPWEATKL
eukprot:m.345450 g.345450  ORF g.345450 m.345450 type:complete len:436 (+) comp26456_c0_seq1:191-1498(+)